MNIEEALTYELQEISGLSMKVFPLIAPEGIITPYCIYEMFNTDRIMSLNQFEDLIDIEFQIVIYHDTYKQAKELMDLIILKIKSFLLRNLANSNIYCQNVQIDNEFENFDFESRKYESSIDIQISYRED